ncbi:SusC/RagA family TonB-linked outer membrane protein [Pedobacter duraquae]|uniref:Iron complex outermembrane receptor protein n=1 Tax=Pedobacter duraquae TaxID=425511 RepID=A0A4V3C3Q2_9SPHI|nr:TonB-dependent receptor [Pedobacter duraquae]TDO22938.1 iron complex outermembrane receptor protein [Pedobacter duraquae]
MKKNYFFYLLRYGLTALFFCFLSSTYAQQSVFTGKVVDENNSALSGSTLQIKGTSRTTVTDTKGEFQFNINQTAITVIVSYVGYDRTERIMTEGKKLIIQLRPDAQALSEVVVVGYGTTKKSDLTGAVSSISSKDFNQGVVTSPLQQIAGRAAGVVITQTGSEPGSSPNIKIRGITSIQGNNNPLVVIDGVQGDVGLLNQIPPTEIESIEVLKDASATAIYGSRGASGVLIVTMKKSKSGSTIEYTANSSVDVVTRQLKMLTAAEWSQQAAARSIPASSNFGANTDWFGLLTRNGTTQNHTLTIGGGTDNFSYRASLGAILQNGIVIHSDNQRYLGRIEATQKALDNKLTITMTLNSNITQNAGSPGSVGRAAFTSNLISNAYISRPTDPIYKADGTYFTDPNLFQPLNVLAAANTIINDAETNRLLGSLRANYKIIGGLSAEVFGSWQKTSRTSGNYTPAVSTVAAAIDQKGYASVNDDYNDYKLMDAQLNYTKNFGNHHIDAAAVYEWQAQMDYGSGSAARGFVNDLATYNNLGLGDFSKVQAGDYSSYRNQRRTVSVLGRFNYSFMDRYLLTVNFRRDGATVFGENHKWGNFPSTSVAWKIDQEPFMKGQKFFSTLKLRAGYGITGNQQPLGVLQSLQIVQGSGTVYFGGNVQTNFRTTQNANADLEWERKKSTNIGLDFAVLNGRLSGSFDVYKNVTDKLLYGYTVPQPPYPTGSIQANVGSIQGRGIEMALSYDLISNESTKLRLGGNVTLMDSKVLNLSGSLNGVPLITNFIPYGQNAYLVVGQTIGAIYILQHQGVAANGTETIVDQNGDGKIDAGATSPDRVFAGQTQPKYTFAFTPSFRYKNFDASVLVRGSGGNKLYNRLRSNLSYLENLGKSNLLASAIDDNMYTSVFPLATDYWLEDGKFIRLENVNFGYRIPTSKSKHISAVRFSLTGQNLALITKYSGIDPEQTGGDNGIYPRVRNFAIGLNITLK